MEVRAARLAGIVVSAGLVAAAVIAYGEQEQTQYQIPSAQRVVLTQVQPAAKAEGAANTVGKAIGSALLAGGLAAALVLAVTARLRA